MGAPESTRGRSGIRAGGRACGGGGAGRSGKVGRGGGGGRAAEEHALGSEGGTKKQWVFTNAAPAGVGGYKA